MSVCDSGDLRVIENTDTVHVAAASVSDAGGLEHRFNVRSCDVEEESLQDGDLLKGMLTDTFCQVCEAVLLFESQRNSHYEGKRHAQRVRKFLTNKKAECKSKSLTSFQNNADPQKFCELCNMVFSSSVVAKSHYMGKIHAKNMKKYNTTCTLVKSLVPPEVAPKPAVEVSTPSVQGHEQKEESASQGVDLNDPDKYCKLCVASFNNPLMAQQHYTGRKHQRNEARVQPPRRPCETPEQVNSLTCPLCHVTLSSVELYREHQNSKHHTKDIKVAELSQKKVYDSFQDELDDYIQAQRARGLEPKTAQGPDGQQQGGHQEDDHEECTEEPQFHAYPSHLPPPPFRPHLWQPPPMSFRGRFPSPGYSTYPPPLIPGLTGRSLRMWKKGRDSPSSSSSSFSDSSTSSYSSSSDGNRGEDAGDRRKRKRRKDRKRRMEQDESAENVQRGKRSRRERDTKKHTRHNEKTHWERGVKEKPEDKHGKKRPDEDEEERSKVPVMEDVGREDEERGIREETKEKKVRQKKEKKKPKPTGDDRTEEERLWDETILGVF